MPFSVLMVPQHVGSDAAFGTGGTQPAAGEEGGRNGEHNICV